MNLLNIFKSKNKITFNHTVRQSSSMINYLKMVSFTNSSERDGDFNKYITVMFGIDEGVIISNMMKQENQEEICIEEEMIIDDN